MQIDDGEPTEHIAGIECPRCEAMSWELASPIREQSIRVRRWRHSWNWVADYRCGSCGTVASVGWGGPGAKPTGGQHPHLDTKRSG